MAVPVLGDVAILGAYEGPKVLAAPRRQCVILERIVDHNGLNLRLVVLRDGGDAGGRGLALLHVVTPLHELLVAGVRNEHAAVGERVRSKVAGEDGREGANVAHRARLRVVLLANGVGGHTETTVAVLHLGLPIIVREAVLAVGVACAGDLVGLKTGRFEVKDCLAKHFCCC